MPAVLSIIEKGRTAGRRFVAMARRGRFVAAGMRLSRLGRAARSASARRVLVLELGVLAVGLGGLALQIGPALSRFVRLVAVATAAGVAARVAVLGQVGRVVLRVLALRLFVRVVAAARIVLVLLRVLFVRAALTLAAGLGVQERPAARLEERLRIVRNRFHDLGPVERLYALRVPNVARTAIRVAINSPARNRTKRSTSWR